MKQPIDTDDLGNKLRRHITSTAKQNAPPAVQVSVYDGSRQLTDGYVWGTVGDKRVQVIAPGPASLALATPATPIVVWALPPNPDEASGAYLMIGTSIDGNTNSRAPALITTGVTTIGGGGGGSVTSVGLSASPAGIFDVAGSPVTSSGTLALSMDNQSANQVLAGPTTGAATTPAFRALVAADIPDVSATYVPKTLFNVTNSSGATANVGDVGYIDYTGVYKTTTTAGDIVAFCAVLTGGANTATIQVITSGRITLNYTGGAPASGDCLITSTTGGLVQAQAYYSPSVAAVALAGGAGGTVDALLMTRRKYYAMANANRILTFNGSNDRSLNTWAGTINDAAPNTNPITMATSTNNINTLDVQSTDIFHVVIRNTTRTTEALLASRSGNDLTFVSLPGGWVNGDSMTAQSDVNTQAGFCTMDCGSSSAIPQNVVALDLHITFRDSGATGKTFQLHPYEANANAKTLLVENSSTSAYMRENMLEPLINRRFTTLITANSTATAYCDIKLAGFITAEP